MAHSTWRVYNKKRVSEEMKDVSVKNVDELRLRNRELEDKISRLDTRSGIEEEIRLKFNVVKSDENMVVVVEDEKRGESATSSELSLWQKIKNFFTNN
jgi:cell division protein FtsB